MIRLLLNTLPTSINMDVIRIVRRRIWSHLKHSESTFHSARPTLQLSILLFVSVLWKPTSKCEEMLVTHQIQHSCHQEWFLESSEWPQLVPSFVSQRLSMRVMLKRLSAWCNLPRILSDQSRPESKSMFSKKNNQLQIIILFFQAYGSSRCRFLRSSWDLSLEQRANRFVERYSTVRS